jgi:hypothetical protein
MPFISNTYRVLIASPSDLSEEREAVTMAIHEWNAQHAVAEQLVLLPVKWETHATPASGVRPQQAINDQLVSQCDLLVGIFWTKLGTSTGVAESGAVEEIDLFVGEKKPAMLYFSSRPIAPSAIDLKQFRKLKAFKANTYKTALVANFNSADELKGLVLRHLVAQVHQLLAAQPHKRSSKLAQAIEVTDLYQKHKKLGIQPEEFEAFRERIIGHRPRLVSGAVDPVKPGETGPNGFRVGYTKSGDKVEWLPDDEHPGEEFPMILRRGDKEIMAAQQKFWDMVWWNRHMCWRERIASGEEPLKDEQQAVFAQAKAAAKRIEKKYGKKNLGWDTFDWGLLSGKLSALAWVMGAEWEESLDT